MFRVKIPSGIDAEIFAPTGSCQAARDAMLAQIERLCGFDMRPDDDGLRLPTSELQAHGNQCASPSNRAVNPSIVAIP